MATASLPDLPLNILALDGGGILAASELLILKEMMSRIHFDVKQDPKFEQLDEEAKTLRLCDLFDLIGGSDAGGLIAVLLGRLGLTVDEAITGFKEVSKQFPSSGKAHATAVSTGLAEAVKEIAKKHTNGVENERMLETKSVPTNTFVISNFMDNIGEPDYFRSYEVRNNERPNLRIWEAVEATTASMTSPKAIYLDDDDEPTKYVGAGARNYNPAEKAVQEAEILSTKNKGIGAVLSLGAGHPGVIDLPPGSELVRESLEAICKDCQETHERMAGKASSEPYVYWRFDVQHGMESKKQKAKDNYSRVGVHTVQYLKGTAVSSRLDSFIEQSLKPRVDAVLSARFKARDVPAVPVPEEHVKVPVPQLIPVVIPTATNAANNLHQSGNQAPPPYTAKDPSLKHTTTGASATTQ